MSRISSDQYQNDILCEIVSIAGIPNLTKLLDSAFLQNNGNIQQAINNVITKKSIYKYDNATMPFSHREFSIIFMRRRADFTSVEELQVFDDYCVENKVKVELELSYLMRTILDWIELEKLLKGLKSSRTVKIRLKIDLSESDYILDLDRLPLLLGPIKERLVAFSIESDPFESSRGAIDLQFLKDIEVLELLRCGIKGSFSQYHNLKELEYMPSDTEHPIDISNLPPTLKRLHLYWCDHIKGVANKSTKFPSLESIAVSYEGPKLPSSVKDILQLMTCSNTTNIELFGSRGEDTSGNEEFLKILHKEAKKKGFKLDSLKIDADFDSKLHLLPTKRLDQNGMLNEHWHPSELPSTLQEMCLHEMEVLSSEQIIQYFPTSLVRLELSYITEIDWSDSDLDFSKFTNMKSLKLKACDIGDYIYSFTFPDSIEEMSIDTNGIRSINEIQFPQKLKRLEVTTQEIEEVINPPFPLSLKELDLSYNRIKKIDITANKFGEPLQIDLLDLRANKSKLSFSDCKLPDTLRYLSMGDCVQDEAFHFNDNFCILKLDSCEFKKLQGVTFGSKLKSLEISDCKLTHFNANLPESLEEINLSRNELAEVPVQLCYLKNLRTISVESNEIRHVYLNFISSSLEVFNVSSNKIKEIQLAFPESVTNLLSVDLSANRLKRFSMAMIGHNGKTLHSNLYELVLSENEFLLDKDISTLLTQLPKSVQFMWGKKQAKPYLDTSIYAINELPNRFLAYKKIFSGPYAFDSDMELDEDMDSDGELEMGSGGDEDLDMDSNEGDHSSSG
ncbi:hypothetical protein I9W82_002798 [Candida metapsilosis]|uniref:Uncharacterized protein n=1 Tax=Candida metapsilosis TaxID=273372 RepID=A0A8H8DCQ1_9ASCO|nr:hypothetical protein I9W82_002798 [Candida metapsilosis]